LFLLRQSPQDHEGRGQKWLCSLVFWDLNPEENSRNLIVMGIFLPMQVFFVAQGQAWCSKLGVALES